MGLGSVVRIRVIGQKCKGKRRKPENKNGEKTQKKRDISQIFQIFFPLWVAASASASANTAASRAANQPFAPGFTFS